ncbi:Bacterial dynamin-like protein [Planococcus massiliensis]|uniref:Bacterial dynamin-like protein n=1 Tax=Planococcus massiliensis TaxID=1499687 RepID=A0A098EJP2_9BACL|nr:dynamin family protein [Planococcus massiliensis]CEG22042.1 Bacterial dynamin-like protein [Planococcus massiliensis]
MNYLEEKIRIGQRVKETLQHLKVAMPISSQIAPLIELAEDIADDYYTIMVVGEFKHGKSTFVNALLGKDVMPRGVTPTTATINTVFHSNQQEVQVIKKNGSIEKFDSINVLNQFTAAQDFDSDEIKYIKLFMDAEILKKRVVLIDTPGVNDLSDQRTEVTHQFLPRADVVIFMCSLTSPIKHSEQIFIEEQLMKNGIERTIFAANFADSIDEEEIEEVTNFVERRLENIVGKNLSKVYPVSAKEALMGRLQNDKEMLLYSGLLEIESEIYQKIESGTRSQEKIERFEERLEAIMEVIRREIETAKIASTKSVEQLNREMKAVDSWFKEIASQEVELQKYLLEREEEINFLVGKSLIYFGNKLIEDIENQIFLFQGADIKGLVEKQIPYTIRSQFTKWIDQYESNIQQLLFKLEKEVSTGLSRSFQKQVQVQTHQGENLHYQTEAPILNAKSGNANVKAGLILGGVGSVALVLGAPLFLPIFAMGGLPFVQQKIAEKQLENVKPDLIREVHKQLDVVLQDFGFYLKRYINRAVEEIKNNTLEEFDRLLRSYQMILQQEVLKHQNETTNIDSDFNMLITLEEWIENHKRGVEING